MNTVKPCNTYTFDGANNQNSPISTVVVQNFCSILSEFYFIHKFKVKKRQDFAPIQYVPDLMVNIKPIRKYMEHIITTITYFFLGLFFKLGNMSVTLVMVISVLAICKKKRLNSNTFKCIKIFELLPEYLVRE